MGNLQHIFAILMATAIGTCIAQVTPNICSDQPDSTVFPNTADCGKYMMCYGGITYEQSCPDGKHFDPDHGWCDVPANVGCYPSNCPLTGIHFLPIPGVCDRYFLCINGVANEIECAEGLYFDETIEDCNYKEKSGCVTNPCTVPPTGELEIFPSDVDCHKYVICFDGEPIVRVCAEGLVFDPNAGQCVIGTECIPQDGGQATTADPGVTETTDVTDTNTDTTDVTDTTETTDITDTTEAPVAFA